ncbi:DNA cytosine methyltransferase [Lachnoclostridium pacaense]|uniref:DNA cytosine methyltransferase n=1 Tax=Enterocloster hominis (ex Hitch et al. 2024) TaxID=1917870 RepID=UPI001D0FADD1|nr:DNA cytosine methyltransferase [Lachnoclostridium pacaense]MCC2818975.1 DNA cytosine methyltransferase [Lachnoclostridium pacaense]
MLTLGSLFDGIGVFPLAATRCGITPLWASEIEKAPVTITKRQFPGMAHLGDITKLDGGEIPAVHIITFGSPCQNLSQAGNREGLAGIKSGLFYQAIRIIREMREATNDLYPVIAIWENVMGAFSSNDRLDFRAVLESFTNAEIPMPPSGVWANAGMVRGGTPDLCWRLMDAQYWGEPPAPQRRRRIFIVADFRGQRAGEILFKPRRLLPHIEAGGNCGLPAAPGNRIPAEKAGRALPVVHPFQDRRMRGQARLHDPAGFIGSFGKPTDPFPTLLAGTVNMFSLWFGEDYGNGILRYLTPVECERLMGLPEGWTACGCEGEAINTAARCKALGNAIALPCAEYIMSGIADVLRDFS